MERSYFNSHPDERIASVKEIVVQKTDSVYNITANTLYIYSDKGPVNIIYKIKMDSLMKIYALKAYVAKD